MRYRKLGQTDIEISVVAFGAWAIADDRLWGTQDEGDALAALRAARDAGVTLFDTAEGYGSGRSERLVGRALGEILDQVVIATKASPDHHTPEALREACERSLAALRTDRIDLYQLHWPNREVPVDDVIATLESLRGEGKIRAYGVSNFGPTDLGCYASGPHAVCSNQVAYNLLFRAVEHEIQPVCQEVGVSLLAYSPLAQGLLTGKFAHADEVPDGRARTRHFAASRPFAHHGEPGAEELTFATLAAVRDIADDLGQPMADVAIAWLLAQSGVAAAIVGGRNAEQATRNARAGNLELDADALARLDVATGQLKEQLGRSADMWQNPSRIQ